ncbi:MAG: lasso peptide biosynthesis B2 protein [Woeseia sp.]
MVTAPLILARHAYVCHADEHLVFLDLRQDKYLCLGREQSLAVRPFLTESAIIEHAAVRSMESGQCIDRALEVLVENGLLVDDRASGKDAAHVSAELPLSGMTVGAHGRPAVVKFRDVRNFFGAAVLASTRLRWNSLESTVRRVERRKGAAKRSAIDRYPRVREHTAVFHALRRYYPRDYLCLFDSLSLVEFLARYRVFPQWVFGVTMEPFRAHCWVQDGSAILNDTVENVRNYTPIMCI